MVESPVPAAHVGDRRARFELLDDAVERRQPVGHQVRVVARAEEPLATLVDVVDVVVPADTGAGPDHVGDARRVVQRPECDLEQARQVGGAGVVGQGHRLLRGQLVASGVGVVVDEVAGRLGVEPLADVALGAIGACGQLGGGGGAGTGQRPVETELVAHHHQGGVQGGADLVDGPEDELHDLVVVDLFCGGRHRCSSSAPSARCGYIDDGTKVRCPRASGVHPICADSSPVTVTRPCLAANRLASARLDTPSLV